MITINVVKDTYLHKIVINLNTEILIDNYLGKKLYLKFCIKFSL